MYYGSMREMEKSLKAFANRRRLAILKYLKASGEASVGVIAAEIKLSFKATSKHLGVLSTVDIVEKNQKSSHIFYHLAATQIPPAKHIISLL